MRSRHSFTLALVVVAALLVVALLLAMSRRDRASKVVDDIAGPSVAHTDPASELATESTTASMRQVASSPSANEDDTSSVALELGANDVVVVQDGLTSVLGQVHAKSVADDHEWGGIVELWDEQRRVASTGLPKSGAFEFRDVPGKMYTLVVQAFGFDSKDQHVFAFPNQEPQTNDVWVTRLSKLRVDLLTPDGRPLFGALTLAQSDMSEHLRPVLTATAVIVGSPIPADAVVLQGRAENLRGGADAHWFEYTLDAQAPGWCSVVLDDRVLDSVAFGAETHEIACRLAPSALTPETGSLRLTVREDRGGAPCVGAMVFVSGWLKSKRSGVTDTDGVVLVEGVIAGPVDVALSKDGFVSQRLSARVEPGRETDLGLVQLKSTVFARGQFVLPVDLMPVDRQKRIDEAIARQSGDVDLLYFGGMEFWSLDVRAVPLDDVRGRESWSKLQRIDARVKLDGTFEFSGLAPIEYAVGCSRLNLPIDAARVRSGGDPDWTIVDLRQGGRDGLVLSLSARAIDEFRAHRRTQEAAAQRAAAKGR